MFEYCWVLEAIRLLGKAGIKAGRGFRVVQLRGNA